MTDIIFRHTTLFNHSEIIKIMCKNIKPKIYLEIGVDSGNTLVEIAPYCEKVVAVDFKKHESLTRTTIPNMEFYEMTSDDFFKYWKEKKDIESKNMKFDVVFIDAWHAADFAFRDFENVFPYVSENGFIFLHDTFPTYANYLDPRLCNDCWKTPHLIKKNYSQKIEILTIPFLPGLTIVRKLGQELEWMKPNPVDLEMLEKKSRCTPEVSNPYLFTFRTW